MKTKSYQPLFNFTNACRRFDRRSLLPVFQPGTIAVIGATEKKDSVGRTVLWNLISHPFGGTVFPVNPNRSSVLGVKSFPSVTAIGEKIDLAVIVTPAAAVPEIIEECVNQQVGAAVIISSGFRESGEEGMAREQAILQCAHQGNMRILGPNCFGLMMPYSGLNVSIGRGMVRPGNVGFLSQSGAISAAMLDWGIREQVGFSAFVSMGNMSDVDWSDLIYYLGDDPHTHSIVIYLQSIGHARSFLSAAREIAISKPIVVLTGRENESVGRRLPVIDSSIAGLVTPKTVLHAVFRRSGVLPVNQLVDLFAMAEILSKQPQTRGRRLTVVSNAWGPAEQAVEWLQKDGGQVATLSPETIEGLKNVLPADWRPGNPVNILRDADAERYRKAVEVVLKEKESDGTLVILVPQAMANPTETAEQIKSFSRLQHKPFLVSWMGGHGTAEGKAILNRANIPTFPFPDTAAQVFNYMWKYSYNLQGLFETPELPADSGSTAPKRQKVARIIDAARQAGRTELTRQEALRIIAAYHLPVIPPKAAAKSCDIIFGVFPDPHFGPVLLFGAGGNQLRIYRDISLSLPPLTTTLARRMMEQTRIYQVLGSEEACLIGQIAELASLLVKFSHLVVEQRWIREIEINPLVVNPNGIGVKSLKIHLHAPDMTPEELPRLAIRPYPSQYRWDYEIRDMGTVKIRPIRPEDEPLMAKFHETLSDQSVYLRYFHPVALKQRVAHERLARICFIDYDREMLLVVERPDPNGGEGEIVAVGRLNKLRGVNDAEFAITISDNYQRCGLGTALLSKLVEIGRMEKVDRIVADILPENRGMIAVSEKVGFKMQMDYEEQVVKAVYDLRTK